MKTKVKNALVPKFPLLTKMVKALLSLPHGTASVERGFAERNRIKTQDRNRLAEDTINHLMMARATKRNGPNYQFPVEEIVMHKNKKRKLESP